MSQDELTKRYFNEVAKNWVKRTSSGYPTAEARQQIVFLELERLKMGKKIIDLGCGVGQLVIKLLKQGYKARGIDFAKNMIKQARKELLNVYTKANAEWVFQTKDMFELDTKKKFDVVIAMGLLEYLEDDMPFLLLVKKLLKKNGYALIECRNRLFNITSANQYTLNEAKTGNLEELIHQLDTIDVYSPFSAKKMVPIQLKLIKAWGELTVEEKKAVPTISYPAGMIRRQHTPRELEKNLETAGLQLKHAIYYHPHPYLPRYEQLFPLLFNKLAALMFPIGYTLLGATTCSAFVAVVKK